MGLVKRLHIDQLENSIDKEKFVEKFKPVYQGIGKFPYEYDIKVKQPIQEPIVRPPRRIPFALRDRLERKLEKMVEDKIIVRVDHPTSYCSHLVVVEKPNKDLRICLDPVDLNQHIEREHHLVPTLEQIKYKLAGKTVFSVIDLKDSFHQVKLSKKSTDFCTFSTPFGYFKYLRLPFGLVTSPEIFMKINNRCFGDIEGVLIYCDDLLIASADRESHLETLEKLHTRALELGVKFNLQKFQFMANEIKYLGHIFNEKGCSPDRDRISSVLNLKPPNNVKELQSILGMFNYMREFIPNMAEITSPLRILLKKTVEWHWTNDQQKALDKLKEIVTESPVLRNFDPKLPVTIQCDSSANGMGCVILQNKQPKNLCKIVSNRCVKMRLALLPYDLDVTYLPGSQMYIADLLSRNFVDTTSESEMISNNYVHNIYQEPTILNNCLIAEHTNVLYYNDRIVIPKSLKNLALKAIHVGHLGVTKTILRSKSVMYWININNDIESFIKNCLPCQENLPQKTREPLIAHEIPQFPFQTLFIDIMTFDQTDYLVVIDQYSKWIELFQLNSKKCKEIIKHLKLLFASKGVAKCIVSDNSPFNSEEIGQFCKEYSISWRYSSPLHPISHGLIERAVGICKNMLKKAKHLNCDYLELLAEYRATPIPSLGVSPSEMLMGRLINTKIPVCKNKLKPLNELGKVHESVLKNMSEHQKSYKSYYDKKSKVEKPFEEGENVLMRQGEKWVKGRIVEKLENYPRSYVLETEKGKYRRNSIAIKHTTIGFNLNESQPVDNFDDFLENKHYVNLASKKNTKNLPSISSQIKNNMCSNVNVNNLDVEIHRVSSVENVVSCENVTVELPATQNVNNVLCEEPTSSSLAIVNQNVLNLEIDDHEDNWYDTTALSNNDTVQDPNVIAQDLSDISLGLSNLSISEDSILDSTCIENDHDYLKRSRSGRLVIKPKRYQ
ncbi:hypothetical protein WDU94_008932 [Cyamophila willieti]